MKRKRLVWYHHLHAIVFILLLLTGSGLYTTYFRTLFNKLQLPIVGFHFWLGIFYICFIIVTVKYAIKYIQKRAPLNKFNVWLFIILFISWTVTGLVMHFQHYFPVALRNTSVTIHDYSTWIIVPWLLVHGIGHLFKQRIPWPNWWRGRKAPPDWVTENEIGRREVVQSIGLFFVFVFVGGWMKWLSPVLNLTNTEKKKSGYFRIYNVTDDYPRYNENEWKLSLIDSDDQVTELTMKDMRSFEWYSIVDDFHCVTGWSVHNVELRGAYVKDVLKKHVPNIPHDAYITAYSGDGMYYDSFKISQLMNEDAMLIFELDGQALKKSQGFPCRLYHPQMYGYKSVKWLNKMEITDKRKKGYWQTNGDYDVNGYI